MRAKTLGEAARLLRRTLMAQRRSDLPPEMRERLVHLEQLGRLNLASQTALRRRPDAPLLPRKLP